MLFSINIILLFILILTYSIINSNEIAGYSTFNKDISTRKCFKYKSIRLENKKSSIIFNKSIKSADIYNEFKRHYSFSALCGLIKKSGEYLKKINVIKQIESINFLFTINSNAVIDYETEILNQTGKEIYLSSKNPLFPLICGDELVREGIVEYILSFQISFPSELVTSSSSKSGEVNDDDIRKLESMIEEELRKNPEGGMKIIAHQVGGDPKELEKILSKEDGNSIYNSDCSKIGSEKCLLALKRLFEYARTDFPSQLKEKSDNILLSDFKDMKNRQSVKNFNIFYRKTDLNNKDRKALELKYETLSNNYNLLQYQIEKLVKLRSKDVDQMLEAIEGLTVRIKKNFDLFIKDEKTYPLVYSCFENPETCGIARKEIEIRFDNIKEDEYLSVGIYNMFVEEEFEVKDDDF